jgi:HD-GYP domain-containing protein (c-di-GMP phosphodiesterase class II)
MDTPEIATLIGDFAGVLARIERDFEAVQIEHLAADSVRIHQRGAVLAVLAAGSTLPQEFDIALIVLGVGAGEALARALEQIGSERVQLLLLPSTPLVVDQAIAAGLSAARQRRRAEMVDKLLDVGAALVAERDPSRLLELILGEARRITGADAGSIYVVEAPNPGDVPPARLRFRFAENASLPEARFDEFSVEISERSVVGACVLAGVPITLRDCYGLDEDDRSSAGRSFPHDRSIDEQLGYQTRSMLTVPMRPPDGEVLGAIQLINARVNPHDTRPLRTSEDFERRVVPFDAEAERLCRALAAQGAVALENARLYAEIEALFEGFVRASVKAIEQRDPTTSGHSERVATLTVGLAEVVDRISHGPLAHHRFEREALRELEYAALLHDFGKVGVREDVLVKAKKLYPEQRERVISRFDHMRTALRLQLLEQLLRTGQTVDPAEFEARLAAQLAEVDALQELVELANEPTILLSDCSAKIRALEGRSFRDGCGREIALLEPDDIESLLITRGSLTDAERRAIQEHVVHTAEFLAQIPWGRTLNRVPDIAAKHHRYLDDTGYPEVIVGEISIQTRMMTIADIFDALTAADRPYKKAVPLERALGILEMEVEQGKLDRDLFDAFIGAEVYAKIALARP